MLSLTASAYDAEINGIFYYLSGNEAEVTSYNHRRNESTAALVVLPEDREKKYSGVVKIPKSVTYNGIKYKVTSIGLFAFQDCYFAPDSIINNSSMSGADTQAAELKKLLGDESSEQLKSLMGVSMGDYWGANLCDAETTDGLLIKDGTIIKCRSWAKSVTIPNSVERIDQNAFCDCPNLTTVIIGNGVKDISFNAFFFCTELRHVYCYATTPPNIPRGGAFNSIVRATTLHVPAASIEAYKANESWNRFKSIMAIE